MCALLLFVCVFFLLVDVIVLKKAIVFVAEIAEMVVLEAPAVVAGGGSGEEK